MVPFWYIAAIRSCLQSGEMLAVSEGAMGVVCGRGLLGCAVDNIPSDILNFVINLSRLST